MSVDAAHSRGPLENFHLFAVVGLSSKFELVPLLYVWLAGNESNESWARVLALVKDKFPRISGSRKPTVLTDMEKGLHNAMLTTFGEGQSAPEQMVCYHHRALNLAVHRKRCVDMYTALAYAPTLGEMNRLKSGPAFHNFQKLPRRP